jgi:starch phosphorylase
VETPEVGGTLFVGQKFPIKIDVVLGEIKPEDVAVEIVAGKLNSQEQILEYDPAPAVLIGGDNGVYTFSGEVTCQESGRFGITARIIPKNDNLPHTIRPKMISWW